MYEMVEKATIDMSNDSPHIKVGVATHYRPLSKDEGFLVCGDSIYGEGLMCASQEKAGSIGWTASSSGEKLVTTKKEGMSLIALLAWIGIVAIVVATILAGCSNEPVWAEGITTNASYYTYASCLREGTSGITASGEKLHDEGEYTFAHPTAAFGERLRIKFGNREIVARCNDRGPNTKCLKRGTGIDLNLSAFKALVGEDVSCGLVKVSIERIK